MNKVVQFEVAGKEYLAIFDWMGIEDEAHIDVSMHMRDFTTCVLVTLPERQAFAGAAILHPKDKDNPEDGERTAFRRAVFAYILTLEKVTRKSCSISDLRDTAKIFQKSMGAEKYKIYGKETK